MDKSAAVRDILLQMVILILTLLLILWVSGFENFFGVYVGMFFAISFNYSVSKAWRDPWRILFFPNGINILSKIDVNTDSTRKELNKNPLDDE